MTNYLWLATMDNYSKVLTVAEKSGFQKKEDGLYSHPNLPSDVSMKVKSAKDCHITANTYLKFHYNGTGLVQFENFRDLLRELKVHMPDLMVKEKKDQTFLVSVDSFLVPL